MKKKIDCRCPRSIRNVIWLRLDCRMLERNGRRSSDMPLFFDEAPLSCDLPARFPSCNPAKHLLFETQTSGAPLPPKSNQRARLRYQIKRHAARLCGAADQCSPSSNPCFIWALKKKKTTQFHQVFKMRLPTSKKEKLKKKRESDDYSCNVWVARFKFNDGEKF